MSHRLLTGRESSSLWASLSLAVSSARSSLTSRSWPCRSRVFRRRSRVQPVSLSLWHLSCDRAKTAIGGGETFPGKISPPRYPFCSLGPFDQASLSDFVASQSQFVADSPSLPQNMSLQREIMNERGYLNSDTGFHILTIFGKCTVPALLVSGGQRRGQFPILVL